MIRGRLIACALVAAAAVALTGCAGATATPTPPVPAATAAASPGSPVTGKVIAIDSEGLSKVRGFTVRTDDGSELAFVIGTLENGVEFPPGHLAEHLATATPVRVFFRDEAGSRVVYRIEDAG